MAELESHDSSWDLVVLHAPPPHRFGAVVDVEAHAPELRNLGFRSAPELRNPAESTELRGPKVYPPYSPSMSANASADGSGSTPSPVAPPPVRATPNLLRLVEPTYK